MHIHRKQKNPATPEAGSNEQVTLVYEKTLPGYGIKSKDVEGGNFFVIGSEKQMTAYEAYLKSTEGTETKLYRIYPRDYWITGK